jgi:hypothetical protein
MVRPKTSEVANLRTSGIMTESDPEAIRMMDPIFTHLLERSTASSLS